MMREGLIILASMVLSAQSALTVKEVWGEEAVPKNCFEVIPAVGSLENGQRVSDWNQLQDIERLSFEHRITAFKRCFPYKKPDELTSLALYLEVPVDQEVLDSGDKEQISAAKMSFDLDKIGFEYGDCKKLTIAGEISWFEIQYTQVKGVQMIKFADEA